MIQKLERSGAGWGLRSGAAPSPTPLPPATPETRLPLDLARATFAHTQDLIRFMDQKAFFTMSAVGMLTTALGIFISIVLSLAARTAWWSPPGVAVAAAAVLYLALAGFVVFNGSAVFRAAAREEIVPHGPGLLFPGAVRARYGGDAGSYRWDLAAVDMDDVLADYADSIVVMSAIYEQKQRRVNRGIAGLRWLGGAWLAMMGLLLSIIAVS